MSSFWVLFSISLFGGLFGVTGRILGVPLFACFYHGLRRWIHHLLRKKGLPTDTYVYTRTAYSEDGKLVSFDEDHKEKYHTRKPIAPWRMILHLRPGREAGDPEQDQGEEEEEREEENL